MARGARFSSLPADASRASPAPARTALPKISLDPVRQQQTDRDSIRLMVLHGEFQCLLPGAAGPHGVRQARHVPPVRRLALNAKRSCRARREVCDLCLQCVCSLFVLCAAADCHTFLIMMFGDTLSALCAFPPATSCLGCLLSHLCSCRSFTDAFGSLFLVVQMRRHTKGQHSSSTATLVTAPHPLHPRRHQCCCRHNLLPNIRSRVMSVTLGRPCTSRE